MQTAVVPAKDAPYRFTIEDYLKMGEAGILLPEDRVELIDGQVVAMSPIGTWHVVSIMRLNRILAGQLGKGYGLSPQGGLNIGKHSQLVPDIVVVPSEDQWDTGLRGPDCLLVIEVAQTSLATDRTTKKAIYASEGVPEYWIVDLSARAVEVYRDPQDGDYRSRTRYTREMVVPCDSVPGVSVPVSDITPPLEAPEEGDGRQLPGESGAPA